MKRYLGKGVCGIIADGRVSLFVRESVHAERVVVEDSYAELARFERAKQAAISKLTEIYEKALAEVGETDAAIFDIHIMMLEDDDYNDSIRGMITDECVSAEYAVSATADSFEKMFSAMEDSYMRARASDVRDVSERLIRCLTGTEEEVFSSDDGVIICADDLAPSETILLDKNKVLAFVTARGSYNSHTAILARSMDIPAIVGLGEEFLSEIKNGDTAIVDGITGELIISPDEKTLAAARAKQHAAQEESIRLRALVGSRNTTIDGTTIEICANIGSVSEIESVLYNDADGIGLFRSEFLYFECSSLPTEEEQYEAYSRVLCEMEGKRVIIRTMDIGADKKVDYLGLPQEENPALGLRAIRFCLSHPEVFMTQLKALYRASVHGRLGIMFPMITSVEEVNQILALCSLAKAELRSGGVSYSDDVELGIMIETPAAALISDDLAPLVDFFSVGTNDLIQYTLACDRQNAALEKFCNTHHEAVLRLIEMSAINAHKYGKWVGICGELAADTTLTERFLRMGIDELSVSPSSVLVLRDTVRKIDLRTE